MNCVISAEVSYFSAFILKQHALASYRVTSTACMSTLQCRGSRNLQRGWQMAVQRESLCDIHSVV